MESQIGSFSNTKLELGWIENVKILRQKSQDQSIKTKSDWLQSEYSNTYLTSVINKSVTPCV